MSAFKDWLYNIIDTPEYLGTDLAKAAWEQQQKRIQELERELHQQKFNTEHNLSIDQKIADKILELEKENEKLWEKLKNRECNIRVDMGFCLLDKCVTCEIGTLEKFKEWERE